MHPVRSARRLALGALVALPLVAATALAQPAVAAPAVAVPAAPAPAVALGDSFAAGEGLAPYDEGTNTATDQCHRSAQAYPTLLEASGVRRFQDVQSVACSGATIGTVLAGSTAEPSQLAALGHRTRTVTLTVGGNDVGFAKVLADCIYSPAAPGLVPGRPGCAGRDNGAVRTATAFVGRVSLPLLLTAIHVRAPHARIYVTGYPRLFGLTFASPAGCQVGALDPAGQVPLFVTAADARWVRRKSDGLNVAVATAVRSARRHHVRASYVDVVDRFAGHNVCSAGASWVNGLLFNPGTPPTVATASFHPNALGQQAYAAAVAAATRRPRA